MQDMQSRNRRVPFWRDPFLQRVVSLQLCNKPHWSGKGQLKITHTYFVFLVSNYAWTLTYTYGLTWDYIQAYWLLPHIKPLPGNSKQSLSAKISSPVTESFNKFHSLESGRIIVCSSLRFLKSCTSFIAKFWPNFLFFTASGCLDGYLRSVPPGLKGHL